MLTIFGANLSPPAIKVRLVANALGLDYDYKVINIREGEHRGEEHLKRHPAGKVPAIDDDGFILFESNAISRYLCEKNNSDLYPKDLKQRALVDQWVDFSTIHVGAAVGRVLFNRVFVSFLRQKPDEQSLKDGLGFLDRFLPVLDKQLEKSKFLATDNLTIADLCLLAVIDPCEAGGIDLSSYSSLSTWRNNLQQQDFYTKCHKSYVDALKSMTANA